MLLKYWKVDITAGLIADANTNMTGWKHGFLTKQGIPEYSPLLKPIDRWLHHLCDLNNIGYTKPVAKELSDAIMENIECVRFMFFIT